MGMGITNYYPMPWISDMCSGTIPDSFNVFWNAKMEDMMVRPYLFTAPTMSYCDSYQLSASSGDMNYLLDPWFALRQTNWQIMNQGLTNNLFGNGVYNPYKSTKPEPEKPKTEEEKRTERINSEYEDKLDKLYGLLNQIAVFAYEIESEEDAKSNTNYTSLVKKFKEINEDETLNNKEKYEKLMVHYNKFKEEGTVKDFLVNTKTLSVNSAKGVSIGDEKSLYANLLKIGYEKNTDEDVDYGKIISTIKKLNDSNGNPNGDNATASLENIQNQTYYVLDVISSINSISVKSGDDISLIELLVSKRNSLTDTMRGNIENTISSLKTQLVQEAAKVVRNSGLDKASKEKFQDAINELSVYDNFDNSLIEKFNKVYTYTRIVAARKLSTNLKSTFGDIDPDLFTGNLYLTKTDANTIADLMQEKMSSADINSAKAFAFKNHAGRQTEDDDDDYVPIKPGSDRVKDDVKSNMSKETAINAGKEVHNKLRGRGYTYDEDYFGINKHLSKINSDNIIGFMDGFYSVKGHEGLIEYCDDEYDNGEIKMENKKKAIKAMLDRAEKYPEIKEKYAYIKLKEIYNQYNSGVNAGKNDFRNGHKFALGSCVDVITDVVAGAGTGAVVAGICAKIGIISGPVGWIIGGCALAGAAIWACADLERDNERIDKYMKTLYDEIKAKEAEQK